ncbi:MAG: hypothetical protein SFV81_28835 [Pirellulaceae bacterium]|nr:hypothetical protein [Pirellulaceae bacterium]
MAQERPVHEIRLGKVKAAIWRNETDSGPRHSVTISRIYKTETGWESSFSFGRDELPLVSKVADQAHLWIYQQSERNEPEENRSEDRSTSKNGSGSRTRTNR